MAGGRLPPRGRLARPGCHARAAAARPLAGQGPRLQGGSATCRARWSPLTCARRRSPRLPGPADEGLACWNVSGGAHGAARPMELPSPGAAGRRDAAADARRPSPMRAVSMPATRNELAHTLKRADSALGRPGPVARRLGNLSRSLSGRRQVFHQAPVQFHYPGLPGWSSTTGKPSPAWAPLERATDNIRANSSTAPRRRRRAGALPSTIRTMCRSTSGRT